MGESFSSTYNPAIRHRSDTKTLCSMSKLVVMKNYLLLLLITTTLICIGCCKQNSEPGCAENYLGEINLSQNEKLILPYKINDSLEFINETNNTVLLYTCKLQVSNYYIVSENEPDSNGNIPCLGNYYRKETYITQFNDQPTYWIRIYINNPSPFDTGFKENMLRISLSVPGDSINLFDGEYAFNSDSIFTYPHLSGPYVVKVYDSITIAGQVYHKVYLLKGYCFPVLPEQITQTLYSTSHGIISFSTNQNNIWNINKKINIH